MLTEKKDSPYKRTIPLFSQHEFYLFEFDVDTLPYPTKGREDVRYEGSGLNFSCSLSICVDVSCQFHVITKSKPMMTVDWTVEMCKTPFIKDIFLPNLFI